ncbi:RAMP superfamily CRISPR-associated protein [Aporhodopirellula aestuarii]|uniref:RAMP superfamily CRISPR-associated protein n=1 Tax=Aporhodopirellula aestuarii TaxID=2950107 RepID=A0ABT0U2I4_9BACT|nr:RAMP superfamily CRISPR-associated protein [Aporhodopirellula aestuarii]MCM2371070.1 RAMP superfamily CRISPR-associated protein [Aporhodopirellula aestuarii]
MPRKYPFTITLNSDAQPATGLGGETFNSLVTRDASGNVVIRGSHLKGLMRDRFTAIGRPLGWDPTWTDALFGRPGSQIDSDSAFRITDATTDSHNNRDLVRTITRTAISSEGTAEEHTLRTDEAIAAKTAFQGHIIATNDDESLLEAWQLALLSISAIGGSRSRGCGTCVVDVPDSSDDVATLLRRVHKRAVEPIPTRPVTTPEPIQLADQTVRTVRLVFHATAPVCCPEIADRTNTIRSGFVIPASAVGGVILHRLGALDPALATATFESDSFLAWPLLPMATTSDWKDEKILPVRVGLTHRGAKFAIDDRYKEHHFKDRAIEAVNLADLPDGAPLKALDGVLLPTAEGVKLWRDSHMPRVVTTHGVRNDPNTPDGRNLFTVDAMAPMVFSGIVRLPATAAEKLIESLQKNNDVTFGKGRSVRGHGTLTADVLDSAMPFRSIDGDAEIIVTQSPIQVDVQQIDGEPQSADAMLLATLRHWCQRHEIAPEAIKLDEAEAWATTSVRFGWNRTLATQNQSDAANPSDQNSNEQGRLSAVTIIDPGAVIRLPVRLSDSQWELLMRGLGPGRQRGFGAVSPHPGKAIGLYKPNSEVSRQGNPELADAMKKAIKIANDNNNRLPTASQLSAVRERLTESPQAAKDYLRQQKERTEHIFAVWESISNQIDELLDHRYGIEALTYLIHSATRGTKTDTDD